MKYYTNYRSVEEITLDNLRTEVADGGCITWTDSLDDNTVLIAVQKEGATRMLRLSISNLPVLTNPKRIKHCEATSPPFSFVAVLWMKKGWLRPIRYASVFGVNTGSRCIPGLCNTPTPLKTECIMGYDIETTQSLTRHGSFVSSRSPITSLALWCSCGTRKVWTTIKHTEDVGALYIPTSSSLVRKSLDFIASHMPVWLVGYNCYQFDNCCMCFHSPRELSENFRNINSGAKAASKHAFYIDIPGVNNVDLYAYLDKCLRYKYKALSLGSVATHHNLPGKLTMPKGDKEDTLKQLVAYNMNDSYITSKLWTETGAMEQVVSLCSASCAPVIDCVRYVTGTMASCAISSYCVSNSMLMDWSECNLQIGYKGGIVLEPKRKIHRNITVCDFSSMYSTIIIDVDISPENIEVLGTYSRHHDDKILHWNDRHTLACIRGRIIRYCTYKKCITCEVLTSVTGTRKKYKQTDPSYSLALKVLANSLYGALGYACSPLHSPRCAATVTTCGRTALAAAYKVFSLLGLTVVYEDTDSCFLASGTKTMSHFDGNIVLNS